MTKSGKLQTSCLHKLQLTTFNFHVPHKDQDQENPDDSDPDATSRPKHPATQSPRCRNKKDNGSSKQHALSCRHCRKTFSNLLQLRSHLAVHGACSEKPFQCSQCGKGFSFEHSLRAHLMLHTGDTID